MARFPGTCRRQASGRIQEVREEVCEWGVSGQGERLPLTSPLGCPQPTTFSRDSRPKLSSRFLLEKGRSSPATVTKTPVGDFSERPLVEVEVEKTFKADAILSIHVIFLLMFAGSFAGYVSVASSQQPADVV